MSTALPSFLNLPLPRVPPPRAYPKPDPAAANGKGKGKAKAAASPPPLRLGAEHAGVTMFRMTMSADNWAALLKTAKSGAKSGVRLDFGEDGQGVLRLDEETSLALGAPKKGGPKTDRHEDVYRVSLPSAASFALHHRSAATAPRLQGLLSIPKGTPSYKVVAASLDEKDAKAQKEQEMAVRLREMREVEQQRKREHQIHRLEMHEDPLLKGKKKRIVKNGKESRTVTPSPASASTSVSRPTGPPKPTLLAPKLAKPARQLVNPRPSSVAGGSAPGTPLSKPTPSQSNSSSSSSGDDASPSRRPPAVKAPAGSSAPKPAQVEKVLLGGMERSSSSSGSDVPLAVVADEGPSSSQTLPSPTKPVPTEPVASAPPPAPKEDGAMAKVEQKKQTGPVEIKKAAELEKRDATPAARTKPVKKAPVRGKVYKSAAEVEDSSEDDDGARGATTSTPGTAAGAVKSKPATTERKEAAPPVQIKKARPPPSSVAPPPAVVIKKARPPPAPQPKKAPAAHPSIKAPTVAKAPSMAQTASSSSSSSLPKPSPADVPAEVSKPSAVETVRAAEISKRQSTGKRKAAEMAAKDETEEGEGDQDRELKRTAPPKKKHLIASTPSDEDEDLEEGEVVESKKPGPQQGNKRKSDDALDNEAAKKKAKTDDEPSKPVDGQASEAAAATVAAPTPTIVQLPKFKRVSNASAQSSRAPSPPGSRGRLPLPMPRSAQVPQGDWRSGSRGRYDHPAHGRSRSRSPPPRRSGHWSDWGDRSPHARSQPRPHHQPDHYRGPLPPPRGRSRSPGRSDRPVSPDRGYGRDRRPVDQHSVPLPRSSIGQPDPPPRRPGPPQFSATAAVDRPVPALFQAKADRPPLPPLKSPVRVPMPGKSTIVPHIPVGGGEGGGRGEEEGGGEGGGGEEGAADQAAAAATARQVREMLLARAAGRRSGAIPPPAGHVRRAAPPAAFAHN